MTEKVTVRLEPLGKDLDITIGTPLIDVINEYGIEFPCGGKGICGRCKVKLLSGNIEVDFMHQIFLETLRLDPEWRLACLSTVNQNITLEISQLDSIILADNTNFDFTPRTGFGIAVDLGTSTIVAQLVDLSSGKVCDVQTSINPQSRYGADIMSRISFALTTNGLNILSEQIRKQIGSMINNLISTKNIDIEKITIVGNTVMHNLFCNIDVSGLAMYPFEPAEAGFKYFSPKQLNWNFLKETKIVFYPSLGSFVGSDILAGIEASGLHKRNEITALIDLGTNGEIVLGNSSGILCASTAAGPAFEGTNISMGMKATTGAVSSVTLNNESFDVHVIGNVPPRGICGSGLIDAVAVLLESGKIDFSGQKVNDADELIICEGIKLTQHDIQEFQLAKAAIAAGLQILVNRLGKTLQDIDRLYIAGGFGNFINLDNVIKLGLIEISIHKIHKLGNSALIGAKMLLFMEEEPVKEILKLTTHVSLESNKNFQDIFTDKMFFV